MFQFHPVTPERHAAKRWRRDANYKFTAGEAIAPLVLAEVAQAAMAFPIAFVEQAGGIVPAAVLALEPGRNLFVGPKGGWLGGCIPAAFRGYPFALAKAENGSQVLCFDEDSGLLSDGPEGEPFFAAGGAPAAMMAKVIDFLAALESSRAATQTACMALQRHQLIQPWNVTLRTAQGEQQLGGLFCIDEPALNALPGDALRDLQQAGGLGLAYCQLLSMQHLPMLGKLAEAHAKKRGAAAPPANLLQDDELNLEFLNSGTISFGGLGQG